MKRVVFTRLSIALGLRNHEPILKNEHTDPGYQTRFEQVFNKSGDQVTMKEVTQATASFERTVSAGDAPFNQYHYGRDRSLARASSLI